MSFSKAKLGCEGCVYEKEITCPAEDDHGHLLPQEQRICYNKDNDEEVILIEEEV